ncbi:hypothetical protein [Pseudacidovorax intermedius]|uniref:hypothetical protein n=1 Tax=Pseudacidovorax intermedius TaxID=433924 RepID=UPI00128F550A|nr:hypothetical protein [Pseudacidovorax intermedius]
MMTPDQMRQVLGKVAFPGYVFSVKPVAPGCGHFYLQAHFYAPDNDAPERLCTQSTRKWLLSEHMTPSELVQTALKLVLTSVEHEAREQFTYGGRRVFGPHLSVDALAFIADDLEVRS